MSSSVTVLKTLYLAVQKCKFLLLCIISAQLDLIQRLDELEKRYLPPQCANKASTSKFISIGSTEPHNVVVRKENKSSDRTALIRYVHQAYLREELGLVGNAWHTMGARWQALATLWLCAEAVLSSLGYTDLSFLQIRKSTLPDNWKEWMNANLMRTDTPAPAEPFGKIFSSYLRGIQETMLEQGAQ